MFKTNRKAKTPSQTKYLRHKEQSRRAQAIQSAKGRDIGPIRNIADLARRESCRHSLERFCLTYNAKPFYRPFSSDHHDVIRRLEEAAVAGALYAFAMPRGSGKSLLCRMAALWAVSYGYRRYPFIIGANASKAEDNLGALKKFIRFLPLYRADFPEISQPAEHLAGIAQKGAGQLCQGLPTLIEWGQDRLILPTVKPPANWPKEWTLRDDGYVPSAGSVVGSSGLTGDGIRGSVITLDNGEQLRPDYVLIDDPQTAESASSPTQNATRLRLINEDLLGMAGPGESISAVMPCTVIAPGDMVSELLDRSKNPLWRGHRTQLLRSMPTNMGAWEKYFDVYRACAQREPPELASDGKSPSETETAILRAVYAEATAYYLEHRQDLDEGCVPSWAERKADWEESAIQHAMHLYCRDPRAFASNYQNQPLAIFDPANDLPKLTADAIIERINHHDRGTVPTWATTLTAAIDVHKRLLVYCVTAWGDGFNGAVVDYGVWPGQGRSYFQLREANPTLADATGHATEEAAIYAGLEGLADSLLGREWKHESGVPLRIAQCVVDVGWKDEVVYRFCRESRHAAVLLASKGFGISASKTPMSDWRALPGEKRQKGPAPTWSVRTNVGKGRHVIFDANIWKTFVYDRLLVPKGQRSALMLFGERKEDHRLFADHVLAETRVETEGRGRKCQEWSCQPGHDNHFFDALAMAAVAASMHGASLTDEKPEPPKQRRTLAEMRKAATRAG